VTVTEDEFASVGHISDPLARLNAVLAIWRDKLVSFDGRNRQLYYRRLKSGDVDFEDGDLDPVTLNSLMQGKTVKVSTLYPKIFGNIKSKADVDLSLDENLDLEESTEEDRQDEERLSNSEKWAKKLRKFEAVYRKAKENYDEKNIETCFLAEGFISWEPKKPGPTPHAPLILHPIKIEPTARGNSDFQISKSEDAFFNQALVLFLQKDFGIDPAIFEVEGEITIKSDVVKEILEKVRQVVTGYKYYDEKVLGNFSFLKYPMVQDLNRIISSETAHLMLLALSGNNESIQKISDTGQEMSLEELSELNPVLENLIFPADSSQHAAISAVLGGKSVVIQGPPGSGKSQTIANLIAEAVVNNKKVLFVAEKRAAIDAVTERLGEKGLGGLVLDLHGEPDKKTIAKNLLSAVKAYGLPQRMSHTDEVALLSAKKKLNDRWKWLNQLSGIHNSDGIELSIYDAILEVGNVRSGLPGEAVAQANLQAKIAEPISRENKDSLKIAIKELYDLGYFEDRYQESETLKEFRSLTEVSTAELIVETLNNLDASFNSPYWKRIKQLFKQAFKLEVKNIGEFKQSFEDIRTHTTYLKYLNLQDLDPLEELLPSLLSFSEFKNKTNLGLVSAFFAKRRNKKLLMSMLKSPWTGSNLDLLKLIKSETELLAKWSDSKKGTPELSEVVAELDPIINFVDQLMELIGKLQIALPHRIDVLTLSFSEIQEYISKYLPISDLIRITPAINSRLAETSTFNLTSILFTMREFRLNQSQGMAFWELTWLSARLNSEINKQYSWKDIAHSLSREVDNFRELDTKHLRSNTTKILSHLTNSYSALPIPDKTLLTRESEKNHSHLPFRKLLDKIPDSIQKIKPVMAMSPLSVSRLLPCKEGMFDIVIFDEASQIKPEDAITSIFRGKQLVVAGDRFQLPPTNFGEKTMEEDVRDSSDEYSDPATTGMESILTSAIGVFSSDRNVKPLRLHYRSNDERLISWSNFHIYRKAGEELFTFPSLDVESHSALRYSYLPNVKTQSMSVANEAEIQKVKSVVLDHVKKHPDMSLGIIAFGMRHSIRLQDEFNILEKENDDFYNWKQSWAEKREKFFIKNIERVQGDERDAIIISPGYAPNLDGNVPLQFGSLNRQGGERRLNVAASRSKEYMHLVTSMRSSDIDLKRTKSSSIALMRSLLEFMENEGRLVEAEYEFSAPTTPFEEEILNKLSEAGLTVDCQVGDSGFKIDFAVRDPKTNKYLLAIEADGATYHSSEYARERDYMRQRILENRGWRFVRIWSTDWWTNPDQEVQRVLHALTNVGGTKKPSGEEPVQKAIKLSNKFEEIEEFKILRGIKDQNQGRSREYVFELWFKAMGFQRRTQNLINRFNSYWRDLP
jgi:very-short-patch-repair endonuclease